MTDEARRIDPVRPRLRWEVPARADEQAREILRTHAPESLPDDVRAELRRLVAAAEKELA